MVASADDLLAVGPPPRELCLTVGLSLLLHGVVLSLVLFVPHFRIGTYISVPVTYQVDLVSTTPGSKSGGGPPPARAQAPVGTPSAPVPAVRPAPAPRPAARPTEELTLPGKTSARKAPSAIEPSLRPPSISAAEPSRPTPAIPVPAPQAPATSGATPASPQLSTLTGNGAGKSSGVEIAGPEGSGAGGTTRDYYLTLVDNKIRSNWVPVGGKPEDVVIVRFRVLRSGQVRDVELDASSGDANLDASALRAVRQSLPLPPFPNLLSEPSLDLRYRFVLVKNGVS